MYQIARTRCEDFNQVDGVFSFKSLELSTKLLSINFKPGFQQENKLLVRPIFNLNICIVSQFYHSI